MTGGLHELSFDACSYSRVVDVSLNDATLVVRGDFVATLELHLLAMTIDGPDPSIAMRAASIAAPGMLRIPAEAAAVRVIVTRHERGRPLAMIVGRPSESSDR